MPRDKSLFPDVNELFINEWIRNAGGEGRQTLTDDPKAEWTAKSVFNAKLKFAKNRLQTVV